MDKAATLQRISEDMNVSRETLDVLEAFAELLVKWNNKINLVSPASVPRLWDRHIMDSAQLLPLIPTETRTLVDIGTGGGFPGVVIAVLAREMRPDMRVIMVESDRRKCAFLLTASQELGLDTQVISDRVEAVPALSADVLTSRALAPTGQLLAYAERHLARDGTALLFKGKNAQPEVDEALASWSFDLHKITSRTSDDAVVLKISNLRRR